MRLITLSLADELHERELGTGRNGARKAADLAEALGVSEREIRSCVEELRGRGVLVGSGQDGYYLIETVAELEETARHLVSRASRMLRTVRAMRRGAAARFGVGEAMRLFEVEGL
ncbi:MAG: hypothetical protein ACT4PO_01780 [Actinomycetota bacterium]